MRSKIRNVTITEDDPIFALPSAEYNEILKKALDGLKTGAETILKDDEAFRMKVQELEEKLQQLPAIHQEPQARGEEQEEEQEEEQKEK